MMNQHYNFDPGSDEHQALALLARSIQPTKVEHISPRSIRWTFGSTITESGDEEFNAQMAVAIDFLWRLHVKRTPELPSDKQEVLLWYNERWQAAYYMTYPNYQAVWWIGDECDTVKDGQYWMLLPTFDPSEVQA